MLIRPLRSFDILQCVEIVKLTFANPEVAEREFWELSDSLKFPILDAHHYVAHADGALVGFAGFIKSRKMHRQYDFTFLAARPDYQGKGIGRALTEHRISEIARRNGTLIELTTRVPTWFAHNFGFEVTRSYGEWTSMAKQLGDVSL